MRRILFYLLIWIIVDKVYSPSTRFNGDWWIYTIENRDGVRKNIKESNGTFIIGDKVIVIDKKNGILSSEGLERVK